MTDKEKILAEIERLEKENCMNNGEHFCMRRALCLGRLRDIISPMMEEPVSKDLDEAAKVDAKVERSDDTEAGYDLNRYGGFIAGAKWQKEQMMANAVDGAFIRRNRYTRKNVLNGLDMTCDVIQGFKDKDKIKVLFIKDE